MKRVEQTIVWRRLDTPGFDACYHGPTARGWRVCGTSVFFVEGRPCHIGYAIDADERFCTRSAHVFGTCGTELVDAFIVGGSAGTWSVNGVAQHQTKDCTDLDLAFTPAARLLTLRRLALGAGQDAALDVARLVFPGMRLGRDAHSYLRLNDRDFRFRSTDASVATVVSVDDHMALLRHPGRWEQHNGTLARLFMAADGDSAQATADRPAVSGTHTMRPTGS